MPGSMTLAFTWRAAVLAAIIGPFGPRPASANWLLQCSSCVDQAFFSDESLKENLKDADLEVLLAQLKQVRLREFDHREDEFYNKFFSKRQLGIITQELQSIMPSAVAHVPERRWTNAKGVTNMTKNVMLLRESHLLMSVIGSTQLLARKADFWDSSIERLSKDMEAVFQEQNDNRRKREDMLDQIVRTIAKVEVLQHTFVKTEEGFVRLETDVSQFKLRQEENHAVVQRGLAEVRNTTEEQNANIAAFKEEFRAAVEREARADLVEKRKTSEADLEVALVKRSIERLRWEEEQKTINMRAEEQRKSEDHSSKLHQERVAHELAQKKLADLELLRSQEESNMRQEEARKNGEKELLLLRLKSDERRAEMGVQEAIEKAKVESEANIRAARENEDVNLRKVRAEAQERRQQVLDAIKASAEIAYNWVSTLYSSPQNLAWAIGSIVACVGGVFLAREMAVLLREQLNKRLGRPSLVRSTNRRGTLQQFWLGLLRLLRLAKPHGSEFSDVVLHPKLHQQVMRLADATRSAKRRKMPLQHAMFYGPPGTGKTMVAQRFAEYSGLEYAIMSGGDVAPLEEQAVTELHKLFKWVHRSRRGVLLFIDEADAFLTSRKKGNMSESLRNALTTILYHTGTPTSQFMLVIATNRPGDLDSAVLDRLDESVEFGLPDVTAREGMIKLYYEMYITKPLKFEAVRPRISEEDKAKRKISEDSKDGKVTPNGVKKPPPVPPSPNTLRRLLAGRGKVDDSDDASRGEPVDFEALSEAARRLHGFSGREISKLFTSLQTCVLYNVNRRVDMRWLPQHTLFEVIDAKVVEHDRTNEFQVSGYNYQHHELKPVTNGSNAVSIAK